MERENKTRSDSSGRRKRRKGQQKAGQGEAGGTPLGEQTWSANFFDRRERRRYKRALQRRGLTADEHGVDLSGPASEAWGAFTCLAGEGDALSLLLLHEVARRDK